MKIITKEQKYRKQEIQKKIEDSLSHLKELTVELVKLESVDDNDVRKKLIKSEKQNQKLKSLLDNYINT